jgi:hypothetical protein
MGAAKKAAREGQYSMSLFSRPKRKDEAALSDLDRRIAWFREILHANNAALGFIAELQEGM